ncbi:DUF2752 domain-containing protein [Antarcticibacterium flavum]|uniref:DUF2752 domain-containing protein n=1 Tax=Antarcticibacterium flavum TaxID=2058175 RepID=A0A5B7WYX3_9FLAO|nr:MULTISPECIES: DUF2752 domain-containing protein [Antarcticibacterium]MCM4161176.1 DUF2752 domain-containing protein [Antarcticibacterium sp. W02-3]QCY68319.1 DUF2752 domain-containing protein [Antarcticibacterium flavum]
MEEFLLPCLNKEIFGLDCYGCGGQRALLLLLKGEFGAAFKLFPPIYPILLLLAFVLFNLFYKFKNDFIIKMGLVIITAAILVGNYLFKMFQLIN